MMSEHEQDQAEPVDVETQAREANAADLWDDLWDKGETADWRRAALSQVYTRIERAMPEGTLLVVDVGGGQGDLARILQRDECKAEVWDHSPKALLKASGNGIFGVRNVDLEDERQRREAFDSRYSREGLVVVCTEFLEHMSAEARADIIKRSAVISGDAAFFSVPNARLAPEEEHQHTIDFTAVTFRRELEAGFGVGAVRVAALGPYLLAICGEFIRKPFTLSMTLPVRNEEAELEKVLASFREVVDEIVVGIDPRSDDGTREIAERYADVVFDLVDPAAQAFFTMRRIEQEAAEAAGEPWRPSDELKAFSVQGLMADDPELPAKGVHFAWVRNQCMRRCSSDWIFMTEGHERLLEGHHYLVQLHRVKLLSGEAPEVISVARQGNRQRWAFPWLCRNVPDQIHYRRGTHNTLVFGDAIMVAIPGIVTLHKRDHDNAMARAEQRQAQNKEALLDDWENMGNAQSLFYLGQEARGEDPEKAAEYLETYLGEDDGNGLTRYQARLMIAKIHCRRFRKMQARALDTEEDLDEGQRKALVTEAEELEERTRIILMGAASDDWCRTEHWIWLGDLAFRRDQLEQALMFYRYAASLVGEPPFGPWWVDLDLYGYLPSQRMAMVHGHLGRGLDAVHWAQKVVDTLPENAPGWAFEEARGNLRQLEAACKELGLDDEFTVPQLEAKPIAEVPSV